MKRTILIAPLLVSLSVVVACTQPSKPVTPGLEPTSDPGAMQPVFAARIDALIPGMAVEQTVDRQQPQQAFEDMCLHAARPGADGERVALCRAIISRLGPESPMPARVWMLRQLAHVGGAESVGMLAELLEDQDPRIRELSRRALQHNPAVSASRTLRAALDDAKDPAWQVALVNALAARRDLASVLRIAKLVDAEHADVAAAAIAALGSMETSSAIAELKRVRPTLPDESRALATDALVRCAERRLNAGDRASAYAIYSDLYETAESEEVRVAGLYGMVRAHGEQVVPLLVGLITGDDPRLATIAARFAEQIAGPAVTEMLLEAFEGGSPTVQVLLLETLAGRADIAARPTVILAVDNDDAQVRVAALRALQSVGDSSAVLLLAGAAAARADQERDAARESLNRLRGDDVDETIVVAMQQHTDGNVRCELIKGLAARWYRPAIPALLAASEDSAEPIRVTAFQALGALARAENLSALVGRLVEVEGDQAREAAENAVVETAARIGDAEQRAEPVLAVLDNTQATVKASLVRVLGRIHGRRALESIRANRQTEEAEVVDAAVRALADWPDPEVTDDLLDITRGSSTETQRVLALRGYVRLVRLPNEREPVETYQMLAEALELAERVEEKKLVLSALGDVMHINAMKLAEAQLRDEALRDEAAVTILKIARALAAEQRDEAVAAIETVRAASAGQQVQQQADEAAEFLQRFAGYGAAWLVAGPYLEAGKNFSDVYETTFPPESPDAAGIEWRPLPVNNHENPWIFDLARAIGGGNRCVYLKTEVWSETQQPARLEIGSDDAVKVWLNGELVHSNLVNRAVAPAADKVDVTLNEGWNPLMLKVVNGSGAWGFCAGFKAPDGGALAGLKFGRR